MKDLVQLIRDNPGCVAIIDNDCWTLVRTNTTPPGYYSWFDKAQEAWEHDQELANSDDELKPLGDGGYGSGGCYGGDILLALAEIVGIRVESV